MSCIKKWEATIWLPPGTELPTTVRPSGIIRKVFNAMGSFVRPQWHLTREDNGWVGITCGHEEDVGYDDDDNHAELVRLVRSVVPEARVETCWLNVEDQEWDATFDTQDDDETCPKCGHLNSFEDGPADRCGDCGSDREGNVAATTT